MEIIHMDLKSADNIQKLVKKEIKKMRFPIPCKVIAKIEGVQISELHVEMNYSSSGIGVYEIKRESICN